MRPFRHYGCDRQGERALSRSEAAPFNANARRFKLMARRGATVQEVFIVANLKPDELEQRIKQANQSSW